MKKTVALLAVIITAAVFSGCQATPEQPVVVQKDMQQMIEKGMASSETPAQQTTPEAAQTDETAISYAELCAHYGVPERYKASITEGNLTINCDVEIELPSTLKLPMAKVEAGRFSQERVYTLFKALCGDKAMYISPELANKEYYEKQIIEAQANLAAETDKDSVNFYNDLIKSLKEQYEKAPEEIELTPADGTLKTREFQDDTNTISGNRTELFTTSAPFEENAALFYVINDAEYEKDDVHTFIDEYGNTQVIAPASWSRITYEREGRNTEYGPGMAGRILADVTKLSISGGTADNCLLSTTPQQARNTVEALMNETGTGDMVIDSVLLYSSKDAPPPPEVLEHWKEEGITFEDLRPDTQAYVFRLLRKVNGVKVESDSRSSSQTSEEGMDFGKEWYYEWLSIAVDDNGIADLYWEAPLVVTEIITEDTAIRPWSEIEDIFKKMIVIQNEYGANSDTHTTVFDITRVSLTLRRITQRDSFTEGLLVPVWNFFGTRTSQSEGEDARTVDCEDYPFLTVNAIDGSVIDIGKGY